MPRKDKNFKMSWDYNVMEAGTQHYKFLWEAKLPNIWAFLLVL
jgi:hypothetical protein